MLKESTTEVVIGISARIGIVAAHGFELIAGFHTLTIVMILWSIEEVVDAQHSVRHLHHEHKKKR